MFYVTDHVNLLFIKFAIVCTHHICNLIFFPPNSTVFILKSIPEKKSTDKFFRKLDSNRIFFIIDCIHVCHAYFYFMVYICMIKKNIA